MQRNPNGFKEKLKTRWFQLRLNQFDETKLLNHFDSNFNELASYDTETIENQIWTPSINIQEEQLYINSWISNRLIFLDNYFNYL